MKKDVKLPLRLREWKLALRIAVRLTNPEPESVMQASPGTDEAVRETEESQVGSR